MATHLTAEQLDDLREELARELGRVRRSMVGTAEDDQPVTLDQTCVGRVSRIDAITNQQMQKGLHEREQSLELAVSDAGAHVARHLRRLCALRAGDSRRPFAGHAGGASVRGGWGRLGARCHGLLDSRHLLNILYVIKYFAEAAKAQFNHR